MRQPSCQASEESMAYISSVRLQVVAGAVEPEAVRVGEVLAGLDAQQRVVGGRLVRVRVVRVVGDQRRDAELLADLQQAVADPALDLDAVVHQLQEVAVLAEDVLVLGGRLQRLVELAEAQPGLQLAGRAAGGGDQPLGPLGDGLLVHPGPLAAASPRRRRPRRAGRGCAGPVLFAAQIVLWV